MCLAVVMESYSSVIEDMQTGLVDDDYKMFYEKFAEFDPEGTRYIPYDQLSDFLDALELPLRIRKPNKFKIVTMVIDICGGSGSNHYYERFQLYCYSLFRRHGFFYRSSDGSNKRSHFTERLRLPGDERFSLSWLHWKSSLLHPLETARELLCKTHPISLEKAQKPKYGTAYQPT